MSLNGKVKYYIIEVHLLIVAKQWKTALSTLTKRLCDLTKPQSAISLIPLYYSHDFEDLEVRICFLFSDEHVLEKYIVSKLRSIRGVMATRVRLTLNGQIFPGGFQALMSPRKDFLSAHIFIKTIPRYDHQIWARLRAFPRTKDAYPTWIFRDFYEYDRDITLRVIGRNRRAIRLYLEKYLNQVPGVVIWRLKIMRAFILIQDKEFLTKLAGVYLPGRDDKPIHAVSRKGRKQ